MRDFPFLSRVLCRGVDVCFYKRSAPSGVCGCLLGIFLLFILPSVSFSQQPLIINHYTEVLSLDGCYNRLTVTNASDFKVGDTVLLIQMKGAQINVTNSSSFGHIDDYRGAGNYEFNYVKAKTGNTIDLLNTVERQYSFADGKVQLVRVPYFTNYTLSNLNFLTAMDWDGNKGGVLAFNVQNTLTLNGNIDVTGKGFRGAQPLNSSIVTCNVTSWFNSPNTNNGGQKGEGIHTIANTMNYGRGAPSNAGGGGNAHNAGGGGGANAGAGGTGGDQWDGCKNITEEIGGRGGKVLANSPALNKLYFGGGGGIGHGNDRNEYAPGRGGGIIIISAGTIVGNNMTIKANGADGSLCPSQLVCNDGLSGAGGGGSILLNIPVVTGPVAIHARGGKGADANYLLPPTPNAQVGPGGGGGGGYIAFSQATVDPQVTTNVAGGANGVSLNQGNDANGATPGGAGTVLNSFEVKIDNVLFEKNITHVGIDTTIVSCPNIFFEPVTTVKNAPIVNWSWNFGDGDMTGAYASNHFFEYTGDFIVKLVVTDANGCKDSATIDVGHITVNNFDFSQEQDICNPMTIKFKGLGSNSGNLYWNFGDGQWVQNTTDPAHTYSAPGTYIVKYSMGEHPCFDTVTKYVTVEVVPEDIIITKDTTLCTGFSKTLLAKPALEFCWSPSTYLDDPTKLNPVSTPEENIKYYYTAKVVGENMIPNGDFSQGNTQFTSKYAFVPSNTGPGQYFVGSNPQVWNPSFPACSDHTTGNGNMMMLSGFGGPINLYAWSYTLNVTPNTNYVFSAWVQSLSNLDPARLRISINDQTVGVIFAAPQTVCNWTQVYTTWNSGSNTFVLLRIANERVADQGNDYALDDISFAPYYLKQDSVTLTVTKPPVITNDNTTICEGTPLQLIASGAENYTWTPGTGLSETDIEDPVARPLVPTRYIVTGTDANGCSGKDTVDVDFFVKPDTDASAEDAVICKNTSVQLHASGGIDYEWSPGSTLNDPLRPDPVATPAGTTKYYVLVTDANTCEYLDSVTVEIHPDPLFGINGGGNLCTKDSIQLTASGGNIYSWLPADGLSNAGVSNPKASPGSSTNYTVTITESVCNQSTQLTVNVNVLPLPEVDVTSSNDLDCNFDESQLRATGASRYIWTPAGSLSDSGAPNPVAKPLETTKYIVAGTDDFDCTNYDSVIVKVEKTNKSGYLMPNAFTPNGDGHNDCYGINLWGLIYEVEFSIFNRWGERIFYTKDANKCWDGRYKGVPQDPGVFIYMIKAKTNCEPSVFRKGHFVLIR